MQDLARNIHRETLLIMSDEQDLIIRINGKGPFLLNISKKFDRDLRLPARKLMVASGIVLREPVCEDMVEGMMSWPVDDSIFYVVATTHGKTQIELSVSWGFTEPPKNLRSTVRSMHRIFNTMKAKLEAH